MEKRGIKGDGCGINWGEYFRVMYSCDPWYFCAIIKKMDYVLFWSVNHKAQNVFFDLVVAGANCHQ